MSETLQPVYVASVSIPGYLPESDTPGFDGPRGAWGYLMGERIRDEDADEDTPEYTDTVDTLRYLAGPEHQNGSPHEDWPTAPSGAGVVYGDTPGYGGDHDLGLAYVVTEVPHADYPHEAGYLPDCPACEAMCHCTPGAAECVYGGDHE